MPVPREEVAKLNKQGFKLVDVRFMPDGYENPKANKPKTASKAKKQGV